MTRGAIAASIYINCSLETSIKRNSTRSSYKLSESELAKIFKHYEGYITNEKFTYELDGEL